MERRAIVLLLLGLLPLSCHEQQADLPPLAAPQRPSGDEAAGAAGGRSETSDGGAGGDAPANAIESIAAQGGAPEIPAVVVGPARAGAGGEDGRAPSCDRGSDSDADGWDDCDDSDADDDGIANAADQAPLDPRLPRGSPSAAPNSVLSDPCVIRALSEYAGKRAEQPSLPELLIHREHGLSDQSGYYRTATRHPLIVSGSDNPDPGVLRGAEGFFKRRTEDVYDTWGLDFDVVPMGYWASPAHVHRGTARGFTQYAREASTSYITSGTIAADGSFTNQAGLNVYVSQSGVYPNDSCDAPYGFWRAYFTGLTAKVTISELAFMCKDSEGQAAYVPPQVWYEADGMRCECMPEFVSLCL